MGRTTILFKVFNTKLGIRVFLAFEKPTRLSFINMVDVRSPTVKTGHNYPIELKKIICTPQIGDRSRLKTRDAV